MGSIGSGRQINFQETEILAKRSSYMDRRFKEATEMRLHSNSIKKEEGFRLSEVWNPTTILLRHSNTYRLDKISDKHREEYARKKTK
jgi:hypothetical protein